MRLALIRRRSRFQQRLRLLTIRNNKRTTEEYDNRSYERNLCNQMKIWSSHLLDNLSNCLMNLKNSGDSIYAIAYRSLKKSTGFVPVTSRYRCDALTNWAMKPLRLGQCHMKYLIYHFTSIPHGLIRTHKWPALNVSGFIAQLVKASHR